MLSVLAVNYGTQPLWVRSRYLRYLAQMAVHEDTDSTNKRNYDVTLGSVLRHNFALSALFLPR